jgi:hypothetical protein
MNINKIESLLLRLISKEFTFVKKVEFDYDSTHPLFNIYVNPYEVSRKYGAGFNVDSYKGPFDFLTYIFKQIKDMNRYRTFESLSYALDDLSFNLASPFTEQYCESVGIETPNDLLTQYYVI